MGGKVSRTRDDRVVKKMVTGEGRSHARNRHELSRMGLVTEEM